MTVATIDVRRVRADDGRVHEANPLGDVACLACAEPFPCSSARDGEQLRLEAVRG